MRNCGARRIQRGEHVERIHPLPALCVAFGNRLEHKPPAMLISASTCRNAQAAASTAFLA